MSFTAEQLAALASPVAPARIRFRRLQGRRLAYIEGWYAIAEANRIFGAGEWSRHTNEMRCVFSREAHGMFSTVYLATVRISVSAGGTTILREATGTGEGKGPTPGEAHDSAAKRAETDATKRALVTFGAAFGLSLYETSPVSPELLQNSATTERVEALGARMPTEDADASAATGSADAGSQELRAELAFPPAALHPDRTGPLSRPSSYFGREQYLQTGGLSGILVREAASSSNGEPMLPFGKTRRLRDKAHLRFVALQPCLICGRLPADAHHLRFAQPVALGRKVSDEFTVPLCRTHHRELHRTGNEAAWWENLEIDALSIAKGLWEQTHSPPLQPNSPHGSTSE